MFHLTSKRVHVVLGTMRGSRGGRGGPDPPLKNHKNIGVLAIVLRIPEKSVSICCRAIIGTDDGPL